MISLIRDDIMGMPITVTIMDSTATKKDTEDIFNYFKRIDERFSTFKKNSEISKLNRREIHKKDLSKEMQTVFNLAEQTKKATSGYFNICKIDGTLDPSGLVKGWAIREASKILEKKGCTNFYIEAGGDIQAMGHNRKGEKWRSS